MLKSLTRSAAKVLSPAVRFSPGSNDINKSLRKFESQTLHKEIWCVNKAEAEFLCNQIYAKQEYDGHSIEVNMRPNAVIIDIGSNIGVFSLYASDVSSQSANIIAIEPVPHLAAATKRNLDNNHQASKFEIYQCAIGDPGQSRAISFNYYPKYSLLSGIADASHNLSVNEKMNIALYCLHCNERFQSLYGRLQNVPRLARFAHFVWSKFYYYLLDYYYLAADQFECELYSLDEVLERSAFDLTRIDLVKVDVEKAELQVLRGIGSKTWDKIQQIVIEVHDVDDRIETVLQMLRQHGFEHIHVTEKMPPKFYSFVVNGTTAMTSDETDCTELVANIYARK